MNFLLQHHLMVLKIYESVFETHVLTIQRFAIHFTDVTSSAIFSSAAVVRVG